ncbi:ABC transporter permease [Nocardioides alcanivorans]|uniref:ABC transporter permease n=1 Tax=Nocardioides alcanivorans TaxID=2897352 RepID=UPI001F217707|nr:ABC transporter permease [Nocardioides alcanivorans]
MTTLQEAPPVGTPSDEEAVRPPSTAVRRLVVTAIQVALVAGFLGLWELASRREWIDPLLFGRPSEVWTAFFEYVPSEAGIESMKATMTAVALAFVIGSVVGTVAGLVLGLSKWCDDIFGPFLVPLNSIPRIALAPMFIAWFGLTTDAKVFLAVTIVFFILAENARSAVKSVDPDLMTMAKVVGLKRASLLWKVVLPSAVPTLFAGLRLTFTYSLLGVIASEMIAATAGIGQDIVLYSSGYQINTVFAIIIELVILAVVLNAIFQAVERRLLRWQD